MSDQAHQGRGQASPRLALGFACIGHLYAHLFEPIFFVAALVLPGELGMPYEQVLSLIVVGKLLYGLLAPGAGWLGDRWSTPGMMAVYFMGLGGSALAVSLTHGPIALTLGLAALGLFGSIYHPVGIAWAIRNATDRGKAIGINGLFGGIGPAVAAFVAGIMIDWSGWRAAFWVPGLAVLATGALFLLAWARGLIRDIHHDQAPQKPAGRGETMRAGIVLSVTMLCSGLIYQATQPALPKLFQDKLGDGHSVGDAALAVTMVYLIAGLSQVAAGHLADRFAPRKVYVLAALFQVPLLAALGQISGIGLIPVALMAVVANMAAIPAENLLLARYTPAKWRGTAFGLKFVLSFGVSGLGVPLVSLMRGTTGDFTALFWLLSLSALAVTIAAWNLPRD